MTEIVYVMCAANTICTE